MMPFRSPYFYQVPRIYTGLPPLRPPSIYTDSPPAPPFYDLLRVKDFVFINFRDEDTHSLTSHLYQALRNQGIRTFIDKKVERGCEIWPTILKAIETTYISVVIFSEGFALSTSCLDELVKILECKKKSSLNTVIPIFYKVDPSHVRHQAGTFADAFANHEVNFKEKVQKWRDALREAADISGFDSKNTLEEAELVRQVVRDIFHKLCKLAEQMRYIQNMQRMQWRWLNNQHPMMFM